MLSFSWKPEKKAIKDAIREEASDEKVKQLEDLEAELNLYFIYLGIINDDS